MFGQDLAREWEEDARAIRSSSSAGFAPCRHSGLEQTRINLGSAIKDRRLAAHSLCGLDQDADLDGVYFADCRPNA